MSQMRRGLTAVLVLAAGFLAGGTCFGQTTGPFATKATVEVDVGGKPLPLQRTEQIAFMFVSSITNMQNQCHLDLSHYCSWDELVRGRSGAGGLKFDPRATDPNYMYVMHVSKDSWELRVTPKKPGMGGFYVVNLGAGMTHKFYEAKGEASVGSPESDGDGVQGDSFQK